MAKMHTAHLDYLEFWRLNHSGVGLRPCRVLQGFQNKHPRKGSQNGHYQGTFPNSCSASSQNTGRWRVQDVVERQKIQDRGGSGERGQRARNVCPHHCLWPTIGLVCARLSLSERTNSLTVSAPPECVSNHVHKCHLHSKKSSEQ